ncbi:MAG: hypothetical protein LLF75_05710 [Eubacteriales bacterium]|nr:hypothetical protein [Eubacteriales bacterium]
MEKQSAKQEKRVLIALLYVIAIVIILLGASFCVYSVINNVQLAILSSSVPGFVFGLVVLFLGVRYVFSLQKLKAEVYSTSSGFAWSNFRKTKKSKA